MQIARKVLTPDALAMLQTIADTGSFAAAARALGMVPSALTYRVRQMEDALDVLLFDRSSRQAVATPAGLELLREGERLLQEIDAVANRVKRVATGWEPQFTIAVDSIIAKTTVLELCERFLADAPPTRIRLRDETLSGTLEALTSGQADLALGVADLTQNTGLHSQPLGDVPFVFAVAPHHPLAGAAEPLCDEELRQHRVVAVADTVSRGRGMSIGLLGGQDVLTVATMHDKLDAQMRGLGCGFLPESMIVDHLATGRLVVKTTTRAPRVISVDYVWRATSTTPGRALQWWLNVLSSQNTRAALLHRHRGV
ncbi:LysR family transcriptional regulator [Rhodoferax sp. U2-2l]|uniref:LysR family transcriptional regulator n=1 Tax=Rhodoferax sp. U2-2l TaxID=2884000 RepID=UPI001D0B0FA0|nr:LysR family transcriptional regulator [Rhodoferax sp. U2-2l]MCB8748541.1 LysR family transcriptional regulator [Rhodoferax sp. U2-2l]